MAIGIVASPTKQRVTGPSAAGPALFGVVAGRAVAPEIVRAAIASETQRRRALPNVEQAGRPYVAAHVRIRWQGWAAFHVPVRLDSNDRATGATRRVVAQA